MTTEQRTSSVTREDFEAAKEKRALWSQATHYGVKELLEGQAKIICRAERSAMLNSISKFDRSGLCRGEAMPFGWTFRIAHKEWQMLEILDSVICSIDKEKSYLFRPFSHGNHDAPGPCACLLARGSLVQEVILHIKDKFASEFPSEFVCVTTDYEHGLIMSEYAGTPFDKPFDDHRIFEIATW